MLSNHRESAGANLSDYIGNFAEMTPLTYAASSLVVDQLDRDQMASAVS
jgi:hypothetical protein